MIDFGDEPAAAQGMHDYYDKGGYNEEQAGEPEERKVLSSEQSFPKPNTSRCTACLWSPCTSPSGIRLLTSLDCHQDSALSFVTDRAFRRLQGGNAWQHSRRASRSSCRRRLTGIKPRSRSSRHSKTIVLCTGSA